MGNVDRSSETKASDSSTRKTDPILPPLSTEGGETESPPIPEGISPGLKKGIIAFTTVTVLIFGVFGTLLIKKILGSGKDTGPDKHETLVVAEKLHQAGLNEQALEQYEKFLNQPGVDRETRSKVSFTAGKLYLELDNCTEGLVYLFQSQVVFPKAPWAAELTSHIDHCLSRLKPPPQK